MGVSDAIDTIGSPEEIRLLNPALATFAKQNGFLSTSANVQLEESGPRKLPGSTGRKRLGRSLRDIEQPKPAP